MTQAYDRRKFIKSATAAGIGLSFAGQAIPFFSNGSPNEKIVLAVMGTNSRGLALATNLARQENVVIAYICDVDDAVLEKTLKSIEEITKKRPKGVKDFRKALEDKSVDAMVIATPDHWHAPAAILACAAGKHVYVEKPCGHNPKEGELLIEAARKYNKVVQMGSQRRSFPKLIEAIQELKGGAIGKVTYAKGWYANNRKSIGIGKVAPVPAGLDYDLWQGPAPRREYKDNIIPYNWHWFWHWGTGEACNNGTHEIDVMRWGMGVEFPTKVSSSGGKFNYIGEEDWETPDTQAINFEFADNKMISWEGRSRNIHGLEGGTRGVIFYGDSGSLVIPGGNSYTIYDKGDKVVKTVADDIGGFMGGSNTVGPGDNLDAHHLRNFLECIKSGKRPNADIEIGHRSTLLCHLGNISQRVGRTITCDPKDGHILNDKDAMALWTRQYQPGWEPKV